MLKYYICGLENSLKTVQDTIANAELDCVELHQLAVVEGILKKLVAPRNVKN